MAGCSPGKRAATTSQEDGDDAHGERVDGVGGEE